MPRITWDSDYIDSEDHLDFCVAMLENMVTQCDTVALDDGYDDIDDLFDEDDEQFLSEDNDEVVERILRSVS